MENQFVSIRPFIGCKDFATTSAFYRDAGFEEVRLGENMSLFRIGKVGFYLQDYYAKDWVDNTMVFVEVEDVAACYDRFLNLKLHEKYENVMLKPIRHYDWGSECFLHDPSGVLWHFGEFSK